MLNSKEYSINMNSRIYPSEVMKKAVREYFDKMSNLIKTHRINKIKRIWGHLKDTTQM